MSDSGTIAVEPPATEAPKTRKAKTPENTKPKRQPPYAVIVENDDYHTYPYVIELFQKVFGYTYEKCYELARTVDMQGQALVWSGAKEVAELKVEQIRGGGPDHYATRTVNFPLGVRMEPLPG